MDSKFLVYRYNTFTGMRDFKLSKRSYVWSVSKVDCWRFSFKGAKSIVDRLNNHQGIFIYGFEACYD